MFTLFVYSISNISYTPSIRTKLSNKIVNKQKTSYTRASAENFPGGRGGNGKNTEN